jgi:hypothetical protein
MDPVVGGIAVQVTVKVSSLVAPEVTVVVAEPPPPTVQLDASPLSTTV